MTRNTAFNVHGLRAFAPPPRGFDALTAGKTDLLRHGLPLRPDPATEPDRAALWAAQVERYRDFEHLDPELTAVAEPQPGPGDGAALALAEREACGYTLTTTPAAAFTILTANWTVPNLHHPGTTSGPVFFRTFLGLGFIDLHVEMTINAGQGTTAAVVVQGTSQVALPVRPGDGMSATLCSNNGTAFYFIANQTTGQTVNFNSQTGFPPAVTIDAGISRGQANNPFNPLARFAAVYFDEIVAYTTAGTRHLTAGTPTAMSDAGRVLAQPETLNERAFKVIYVAG